MELAGFALRLVLWAEPLVFVEVIAIIEAVRKWRKRYKADAPGIALVKFHEVASVSTVMSTSKKYPDRSPSSRFLYRP